jgi:hypothetical protein
MLHLSYAGICEPAHIRNLIYELTRSRAQNTTRSNFRRWASSNGRANSLRPIDTFTTALLIHVLIDHLVTGTLAPFSQDSKLVLRGLASIAGRDTGVRGSAHTSISG